ncbi:hypothetical protein [Streptacidiphilus sp. PAMC 29251]
MSSTSPRQGLGPGPGAPPASRRPPPWAAPAHAPAPGPVPGSGTLGGDGSAERAREAVGRLRVVPVQAAVVETALALARAVLAGQTGHPDVQESARALAVILDRALNQAAAPVRSPVPAQQSTAPTGTGTGNAAQRPSGGVPAGAADVQGVAAGAGTRD